MLAMLACFILSGCVPLPPPEQPHALQPPGGVTVTEPGTGKPPQVHKQVPVLKSPQQQFCEQYAQKTMEQIAERKQKGSLPPDTIWKDDELFHYQWCMSHTKAECNEWTGIRQQWLSRQKMLKLH